MKNIWLLIASFTVTPLWANSAFDCDQSLSSVECLIYQETNRVRASKNEQKLLISPECQEAARYHAERMDQTNVYAHEIPGEKSFGQRMEFFGVRGSRMSENIHHRQMDHFANEEQAAIEIVQDWYDSKGHRRNMMNSGIKAMGIAVVGDFQVQCFTDYADPQALKAAKDERPPRESGLRNFFNRLPIPKF